MMDVHGAQPMPALLRDGAQRIEKDHPIAPAGQRDGDRRTAGHVRNERSCKRFPDDVRSGRRLPASWDYPPPQTSAGRGDLLEPAISEDLVLARFEQRVERLLARLAQRFGKRLLQRHHDRRVVAMGAPSGSLMTLSIRPSCFSRGAVMPSVSAASGACSADFQRIDAQPSGEITE